MKVLMLDPSGAVAGPTHNLCNALTELGCEVHLFTGPYWARSAGRCHTHNYHAHVFFYRRTQDRAYGRTRGLSALFWRAARLLGHAWAMARVVRLASRFDVVHVQWLPVPALDLFWLWCLSRRAPVVYTVHNHLPHDARWPRVSRAIHRALYRLPSALFVHAEHTARTLVREFEIARSRIVRIRHGNMEHLLDLPRRRGPSGSNTRGPCVAFLGQVRQDKGLDVLLRAVPRLRERVPGVRILVAGRPRVEMGPYEDLVRRLQIADLVEFRLRYFEEDELPDLFEAADVVVLPYRSIDQSGVAAAACTFGRAVVATRCGGLEELVEEAENGLLVPVDDAEALADATARILRSAHLRTRFEERSRRYAREVLAWGPIAERTREAYRAALALRSESRSGRARARDHVESVHHG